MLELQAGLQQATSSLVHKNSTVQGKPVLSAVLVEYPGLQPPQA
jgi:hypothetical protein